jgi:hypothetical protein
MVGFAAMMMAVLLIGVQAAVWGIAELGCRNAANYALQNSRVQGGTAGGGEGAAGDVLSQFGGSSAATRPPWSPSVAAPPGSSRGSLCRSARPSAARPNG